MNDETDERSEAFERGLKTMERVALDLYQRGREPLLAELETVKRERDEAIEKLEALREHITGKLTYATQEDPEHPDFDQLDAEDSVDAAAEELRDLRKERDEARAEVERQRELKDYLRTWLSSEELDGLRVKAAEHPLLWEEIHHLKAEVERLREMAHDFEAMREDRDAAIARITEVGVMVATNGNALAKEAYRRGAEAMREACARWMSEREGIAQWVYDDALSALPIPEEP